MCESEFIDAPVYTALAFSKIRDVLRHLHAAIFTYLLLPCMFLVNCVR